MHKYAILYGVGICAVTFITAMVIFPLRANERPLFESIMPVVLTAATVTASYLYFKTHVTHKFIVQGLCLGLLWMAMNIFIDIPLFILGGPMKMIFTDYIKDIAVTYTIILLIPIGFGYILASKLNK